MGNRHPSIIEVSITELSKEGHGIGYIAYPEGKISAIEVPFTIPGDKVKALLFRRYKGIYQSKLEEIIEHSPNRITPRCIHFGQCGGCRWQQISYEQELQRKEQFIRRCVAPYLNDQVTFYPILACMPPWNYRNKVELSFSSDRAGKHYLGFIMYGNYGRVFQMKECHLVHPWFLDAVKAVNAWWNESNLDAYHPGRNTGSLRTLVIREGRRTGDRLIMLTVSGNPDFALNKQQLDSFTAFLRAAIEPINPQQRLSIFLRIQQIAKGRKTNFYEMLLYGPDHIREILHIKEQDHLLPYSLSFKISPTAFFQPNTEQAERLYSCALQMAKIPAGATVYDLYCGTGTLGICAAKQAKEVIGIELTPESVLDARENVKNNGLSNVTILAGDVGKVLAQMITEVKNKPDVIMVDPPRAGLDSKTLQYLIDFKAHKIIYISCNPVTQAGNLEVLLSGGYQLESVQPIDQFPHTVHVENIVILKHQGH
jgi:23S rRNA (uracil1939-C5)-methyltransferase